MKLRQVYHGVRGLRAYDSRRPRTRLPGPIAVQVQTIDRCNASCVMCPYSAPQGSGSPRSMAPTLYTSILEQLARAGSVRFFTPMLQNEPLLDAGLADRVREAKRILGNRTRVHVITNGSALASQRVDELVDAGTDVFEISIDAYREETYAQIRRGLRFSRVVENVQALLRREPPPRVVVRFLRQRGNAGEEGNFVRFWAAQGAQVFLHAVGNRAGSLDDFEGVKALLAPAHRRLAHAVLNRLIPCCSLPFFALTVLCDGRAILCCHDWGPRVVVGNLRTQTLEEVWNGEVMNRCRHDLWRGRPERVATCADCSYGKGMWRSESRRAV